MSELSLSVGSSHLPGVRFNVTRSSELRPPPHGCHALPTVSSNKLPQVVSCLTVFSNRGEGKAACQGPALIARCWLLRQFNQRHGFLTLSVSACVGRHRLKSAAEPPLSSTAPFFCVALHPRQLAATHIVTAVCPLHCPGTLGLWVAQESGLIPAMYSIQ